MNEMTQSLNSARIHQAQLGLTAFRGAARRPLQKAPRRKARARSLPQVMAELRQANRVEEQVWILIGMLSLALVALSLWT